MPDISMCGNWKCDKRHKCYRYMAHPSMLQSYFLIDAPDDFAKNCDMFINSKGWKCRTKKTLIEMETKRKELVADEKSKNNRQGFRVF